MSFVLSPNMSLPVPTVGVEPGPQFAYDINSSLSLIDTHDHSPGRGVLITPAGININATLGFNNNSATSLSLVSFTAGSLATPIVQAVSVAPASSINELWYTDSNGTQTQITSNGQVNAIAAAIPGESYVAGTFIWTQTQSALPTTPANFDIGSVTLRPNTAGTTHGITISPPAGFASSYTLSLPNLAAGNGVLILSSSGAMSVTTGASGTYLAGGTNPAFTALLPMTVQRFTSGTGTYILPSPAPLYIKVTAIGGGGGGGGSGNIVTTAGDGGSTTLGSTIVVSHGGVHGGTGTTGQTGFGGAGGTSSSSATIIESVSGGAAGGIANSVGGNFVTLMAGSSGGSSSRGGAGIGGVTGLVTNGTAGAATSGSGGGGGSGQSTFSYPGGGGGAGATTVALITTPASSYGYIVGAGGSAGTGNASNGGAGGSGLIVVEEFYQ